MRTHNRPTKASRPHERRPRSLALYEAGRAQGARGRTMHVMQSSPAMSASPTFARFGAAERFALCAAVLCLLLQAWPGAPATLEYRVGVLLDEPWRALFGHFVHVNWRHALLNAVAWVLLARLFDRELGVARQCVTAVLAAIGISVMLALLQPGIAWFRGASGVLHALFFAGCATWLRRAVRAPSESRLRETLLPLALFAGGWIKLALEQPLEVELPFSQEPPLLARCADGAAGTPVRRDVGNRPRRAVEPPALSVASVGAAPPHHGEHGEQQQIAPGHGAAAATVTARRWRRARTGGGTGGGRVPAAARRRVTGVTAPLPRADLRRRRDSSSAHRSCPPDAAVRSIAGHWSRSLRSARD